MDKATDDYILLGKSRIGKGTLVGRSVIVGHPSKIKLLKTKSFSESEGAIIGARCILRSFTVIYENAVLGDNVQTAHGVIVREGAKIGHDCVLGNHTVIREGAELGINVHIMEGVVISEGAKIGNNVFIGPGVTFTAGRYMTAALETGGIFSHRKSCKLEGRYWKGPSVIVGERVRIGANAVVLAGVELHKGCVIAAGSVVSNDVPSDFLTIGNPARLMRMTHNEK